MLTKMENGLVRDQSSAEFKEEFNSEEYQLGRNLNCRLYVNLQPVSNCSLFDSFNHCKQLVEEMKKCNDEKAVPIEIVLCPLKTIMGTVGKFRNLFEYRDVNSALVNRCSLLWDKLDCVVTETNSVSLRPFQEVVIKYQELLRESLKARVLDVRCNRDSDDREVESVVNTAENHPLFSPSQLNQWLRYKKGEMELVEIMASLDGVSFFASKNQLDEKLASSASKKHFLVLCVPPLDEKNKKILEAMRHFVDNSNGFMEVDQMDDYEIDDQVRNDRIPWHMIQRKRNHVLDKIRELAHHVEINKEISTRVEFVVAFCESSKRFGCCYSLYEDGNLLKDNLRRLPIPPTGLLIHLPVEEGVKKPKLSFWPIRVEWKYEDLGYPCRFLVEHRERGKFWENSWQQLRTTKPGETETIINSTNEPTMLEVRVAAETCIGRGEFSEEHSADDGGDERNSLEEGCRKRKPFCRH